MVTGRTAGVRTGWDHARLRRTGAPAAVGSGPLPGDSLPWAEGDDLLPRFGHVFPSPSNAFCPMPCLPAAGPAPWAPASQGSSIPYAPQLRAEGQGWCHGDVVPILRPFIDLDSHGKSQRWKGDEGNIPPPYLRLPKKHSFLLRRAAAGRTQPPLPPGESRSTTPLLSPLKPNQGLQPENSQVRELPATLAALHRERGHSHSLSPQNLHPAGHATSGQAGHEVPSICASWTQAL